MIKIKRIVFFIPVFILYCSTNKSIIREEQPNAQIPEAAELSAVPDSLTPDQPVITGVENFLENYIYLVRGKRVGLVTNPSAIDRNFRLTTDLLSKNPNINLTTLFAVEHGIRGDASAGQTISDQNDPKTGLPVFSLYGKTKKPTKEMLQNIDVIIFDIQDVGVRSYTYISSMGMILEAAAENSIEMIILDRPNPLGGIEEEGNILKKEYKSHIGYYTIPYRHGMTIGEIARMYNTQDSIGAQLTIIPMLNWQRDMLWDQTGLPWIPTSPHIPHWQTALFLPMTGTIGELQVVSVGVGYTSPFELIGAPWINADTLADSLNNLNLPGLWFQPVHFKPCYARYKDESCHGMHIYITDAQLYKPFISGLYILQTLMHLYPDHNFFESKDRIKSFNLVMGGPEIYQGLISGKKVEQIEQDWQDDLNGFLMVRKKYLLY